VVFEFALKVSLGLYYSNKEKTRTGELCFQKNTALSKLYSQGLYYSNSNKDKKIEHE
jgi:hypothetical protein